MGQTSFTRSNYSMAFPYVSASEEEKLENLLVSGFAEACAGDLGIRNVAFFGSCSREDANLEESAIVHSIQVITKSCGFIFYGILGNVIM